MNPALAQTERLISYAVKESVYNFKSIYGFEIIATDNTIVVEYPTTYGKTHVEKIPVTDSMNGFEAMIMIEAEFEAAREYDKESLEESFSSNYERNEY